MANIGFNSNLEVSTHTNVRASIQFYDRQRRMGLKRMPLGSPFVLPRVGELVRLPIANDVATEYCVVDIRYMYRDGDDERSGLECAGPNKKPVAAERPDDCGLQLECVRIELDPLL
jgi:hypothetical protein